MPIVDHFDVPRCGAMADTHDDTCVRSKGHYGPHVGATYAWSNDAPFFAPAAQPPPNRPRHPPPPLPNPLRDAGMTAKEFEAAVRRMSEANGTLPTYGPSMLPKTPAPEVLAKELDGIAEQIRDYLRKKGLG